MKWRNFVKNSGTEFLHNNLKYWLPQPFAAKGSSTSYGIIKKTLYFIFAALKTVKLLGEKFQWKYMKIINVSIHLSYLMLSRSWLNEATCPGRQPKHPFPQQDFPALPGGSQGIPKTEGICNPSSKFWGPPNSWTCLKKLPNGGDQQTS